MKQKKGLKKEVHGWKNTSKPAHCWRIQANLECYFFFETTKNLLNKSHILLGAGLGSIRPAGEKKNSAVQFHRTPWGNLGWWILGSSIHGFATGPCESWAWNFGPHDHPAWPEDKDPDFHRDGRFVSNTWPLKKQKTAGKHGAGEISKNLSTFSKSFLGDDVKRWGWLSLTKIPFVSQLSVLLLFVFLWVFRRDQKDATFKSQQDWLPTSQKKQ